MTAPSPTPLTPTARYIAAGTRRWAFVPTIANVQAPTKAEIDAGTDLTDEIQPGGISGFSTTSNTVEAGDYGNRFNAKVPGMIDTEDSSIMFNADKTGVNPVAALLPRDTTGFIVDAFGGLTATGKMNVWPVTVTVSTIATDAADAVVGWRVGFSVTSVPGENIAVPTA